MLVHIFESLQLEGSYVGDLLYIIIVIIIKWSIQQVDITFVNIYAPNIGISKCIKQILTEIKGEMDSDTIIVGFFNIYYIYNINIALTNII